MVIEKYKPGKTEEIYIRFSEKGRMLPEGVEFVDSWVEENLEVCYQLMKSESLIQLEEWTMNWKDLVDFEIVSVLSTEEVKRRLNRI